MAVECCALRNPNPTSLPNLPLTRLPIPSSSSTLSLRRNHLLMLSAASLTYQPRGLSAPPLFSLRNRRSFAPLAASHGDSEKSEQEQQDKESEEAWQRALAAFKEQALRLQGVSQEAYEIYSKKAMIALKETSEQLKIEAAKAKYDLTVMAQELGDEGKQYISQAAENSPEPVKDVVETFTSATDHVKDVSQVLDFYIGIPYGAILSLAGFLDFMVTGRTSAIRFGVILGGTLLALSLSSLRSWRKGESTDRVLLTCETAIAGILFLRQFRLFFQKVTLPGLIGTGISGAVAAFFVYRMLYDQNARGSYEEESDIDGEPQI